MSKKIAIGFVTCVAVALVAIGIGNVYAHCGKCATDAKYFAGALDDSKMTLAAAATMAEVDTGGTAVHATVQRLEKGVNVEVHCLVDGEIMAVVVDGQNGKVVNKATVSNLDGHAG